MRAIPMGTRCSGNGCIESATTVVWPTDHQLTGTPIPYCQRCANRHVAVGSCRAEHVKLIRVRPAAQRQTWLNQSSR